MKYCLNCGEMNDRSLTHCSKCGNELKDIIIEKQNTIEHDESIENQKTIDRSIVVEEKNNPQKSKIENILITLVIILDILGFLSGISLLYIPAFILMIYVRIKYPDNKIAKYLMWFYIIDIIIFIILMIIVAIIGNGLNGLT